MEKWLDLGAAISAFAAAIFWFLSASGQLPPITYLGFSPPNDPFAIAMRFTAHMNSCAAVFSGISALCWGVKAVYTKRAAV
jgi:hypothetical protein